jgi:hypothetical protein
VLHRWSVFPKINLDAITPLALTTSNFQVTSSTSKTMDSPWDDDAGFSSETEWTRISNEFTNVQITRLSSILLITTTLQTGYREGITAGKESALQEGFDDGFAHVGVPLGHELGILRGIASALYSFLSSTSPTPVQESMVVAARDVASLLANIRFTDIAPRDLEAEEHARQHLEVDDNALDMSNEVEEKRKMEELEDMLAKLTPGSTAGLNQSGRPTVEDVRLLKGRLETLTRGLGLSVDLS